MRTALGILLCLAGPGRGFADEVCRLDPHAAPDAALLFKGVVRGLATPQEIVAQTAIAMARVHAPESARYQKLPRVFAYYLYGGLRHGTIAAVVDGPIPEPGQSVVLASRRRDPEAACAFIPWTVTTGTPSKPTS